MTFQSPLRDLIVKIDDAAKNHVAYSQAADAINNLRDHLSALARCEEINRATGKTVVLDLGPLGIPGDPGIPGSCRGPHGP
jgi:hypothetical protein